MIDSLPNPKTGELIEAEHITQIVKAIRKRTPRNSPTVKVVETADGFYLNVIPASGGGGFSGAWKPSYVNDELINLTAGSISDGITTHIPDVEGIVVHATALRYVYLKCTLLPTLVDSIVTGGTITNAVVQAFSSEQTNDNTTGYVLLCTWQAGRMIARYSYWSMQAELLNSGTGTTLFRTWVAS